MRSSDLWVRSQARTAPFPTLNTGVGLMAVRTSGEPRRRRRRRWIAGPCQWRVQRPRASSMRKLSGTLGSVSARYVTLFVDEDEHLFAPFMLRLVAVWSVPYGADLRTNSSIRLFDKRG